MKIENKFIKYKNSRKKQLIHHKNTCKIIKVVKSVYKQPKIDKIYHKMQNFKKL